MLILVQAKSFENSFDSRILQTQFLTFGTLKDEIAKDFERFGLNFDWILLILRAD
jgi:hypothetical protein